MGATKAPDMCDGSHLYEHRDRVMACDSRSPGRCGDAEAPGLRALAQSLETGDLTPRKHDPSRTPAPAASTPGTLSATHGALASGLGHQNPSSTALGSLGATPQAWRREVTAHLMGTRPREQHHMACVAL